MTLINPDNIWGERQNNPELIIEDCRKKFGFDEVQCQQMRDILMRRGINKWLLGRRMFIQLKHEVKDLMKQNRGNRLLEWLNMRMQNIAKLPRYVEFPHTTTHNWNKIEEQIVVKGRKSRNWRDYKNGLLMKCPGVNQ